MVLYIFYISVAVISSLKERLAITLTFEKRAWGSCTSELRNLPVEALDDGFATPSPQSRIRIDPRGVVTRSNSPFPSSQEGLKSIVYEDTATDPTEKSDIIAESVLSVDWSGRMRILHDV
jgi:hypothetical protein